MKRMKIAFAAALLALAAAQAQTAGRFRMAEVIPGLPPSPNGVRMCAVNDVSLATDDENGSFNGMSHSGTLVVLRNLSSTACSVPAIPQITFADQAGALKATLQTAGFGRQSNGMVLGHGPVVLPVVIAPEAEVTSKLRWVSGEVYGKNICIAPTRLSVTLGEKQQTTTIGAHLCGDAANGSVSYEATHFAADPVYTPVAAR